MTVTFYEHLVSFDPREFAEFCIFVESCAGCKDGPVDRFDFPSSSNPLVRPCSGVFLLHHKPFLDQSAIITVTN